MADYTRLADEVLAAMAQDGDNDAVETLIKRYMSAVLGKARLYFIVGQDNDDVIQEGMLGLFKALRTYNGAREASFRTFASLCIEKQIQSAIKAAGRLKNSPLNNSVSLDTPLTADEFGNASTLGDTLVTDPAQSPEEQFIDKYTVHDIEENVPKLLSRLEREVWPLYIAGRGSRAIASELGITPKSADNAVQRIKRKAAGYISARKD